MSTVTVTNTTRELQVTNVTRTLTVTPVITRVVYPPVPTLDFSKPMNSQLFPVIF